jgi:hypothetical protein
MSSVLRQYHLLTTCVANLVRGVNNCQSKPGWNESVLEWPAAEHLDAISWELNGLAPQ